MKDIIVPQTNVNDTEVRITHIYVDSGAQVKTGDPLLDIETTKALFTIEAPLDGFFVHKLELQSFIEVGSKCGVISDDSNAKINKSPSSASISKDFSSFIISKRAESLIKEHDLTPADFPEITSITYASVVNVLKKKKSPISQFNYLEITDSKALLLALGDANLAIIANDIFNKNEEDHQLIYIATDELLLTETDLKKLSLSEIPVLRLHPGKSYDSCLGIVLSPINIDRFNKLSDYLTNHSIKSSSLISPDSYISNTALIEDSTLICNNVYLGPHTKVGKGSVLLPGSSVAHHSEIGICCSISDNATLGGNVSCANEVLIGLNATINRRVNISAGQIIASGKVIINDM